MELYKRLQKLRKSKKYYQKEVASYLNISQSTYSLYETGDREPDIKTISKLANFFDVSVDYLIGNSNNPDGDDQNTIKAILDDDVEILFYNKEKVTPDKLEKLQQIYNLVFNSTNEEK